MTKIRERPPDGSTVANSLQTRQTQKENWRQLSTSGRLYAIVETCHQKMVRPKAQELGPDRAVSLFQGTAEAQFENAAPFFFRADEAVFDWIVDSFWGRPWGILLWSDGAFDATRVHLQKFLRVRGADRGQYLLRFYDPNILGPFLKSCNDSELAEFFGPITAFGANLGQEVTLFRFTAGAK